MYSIDSLKKHYKYLFYLCMLDILKVFYKLIRKKFSYSKIPFSK
jgi:hypothetical protein